MEDNRIEQITREMFDPYMGANRPQQVTEGSESGSTPEQALPADLYEQGRIERFNESKKTYPNGSSPRTTIATMTLLDNLRPRYQKASDDNDCLKRYGDKSRAKMVREQYMNDVFLPALESLVNIYGVDEIINNKSALKKMDAMALIDGGNAQGYSESFIRTLHGDERGIAPAASDGYVVNALNDIRRMASLNQIRSAVGLADKVKSKIDSGEHSASQDDYELLQKVALRGQA